MDHKLPKGNINFRKWVLSFGKHADVLKDFSNKISVSFLYLSNQIQRSVARLSHNISRKKMALMICKTDNGPLEMYAALFTLLYVYRHCKRWKYQAKRKGYDSLDCHYFTPQERRKRKRKSIQIFEINLNHQKMPFLMINLVLLMNFSLAEYVLTLPKVWETPHTICSV